MYSRGWRGSTDHVTIFGYGRNRVRSFANMSARLYTYEPLKIKVPPEDEVATNRDTTRSMPAITRRPQAYETIQQLKNKKIKQRKKKSPKARKSTKVSLATQTDKYMEILWLQEMVTTASREKNILNARCDFDRFLSEQLGSILLTLSITCGFLINVDVLLGIIEFFQLKMRFQM